MCMAKSALQLTMAGKSNPMGDKLASTLKAKPASKAEDFTRSENVGSPSSSSYRTSSSNTVNTSMSSGRSIRQMNTGTQKLRIPLAK